jgi:hypothetical protein
MAWEAERERPSARHTARLLVGELVGPVGNVVPEPPEVRLGGDVEIGEGGAQRGEQRVVGVPGIGDDEGHARTSFSTPGAWTGARVDVR